MKALPGSSLMNPSKEQYIKRGGAHASISSLPHHDQPISTTHWIFTAVRFIQFDYPTMSRYTEVHKIFNLHGPGDARPTALQIVKDEGIVGKLSDKIFLITGVSAGLGIETLRALHATGAHIYGTVRSVQKGQKVVNKILSEKIEGGGKIDLVELELDNFESIKKGAQDFLSRSGGRLNVLVANAGVITAEKSVTKEGFEQQWGTNHLGHFLLFQLLKDALLTSGTPQYPSRYVSVASIGHFYGTVNFDDINWEKEAYKPWVAYGRTKTANIWMANSIERRFGAQHLHATSIHPGTTLEDSELARNLSTEEMIAMGSNDPKLMRTFKSAPQGAATQVFAAVSKEWANKGGRYLSNCVEQVKADERVKEGDGFLFSDYGYMPWAYDEENEERLWKESLKMVGLEAEA
jgi:NAD(P)-dependent dehydrogenase (short-subunit alcohol dehydrogenase family)